MSIAARLTLLLLGLLALVGTHWRAYHLGLRHERNAVQSAQAAAARDSAATAIRKADNIVEAVHDRTQTQTRITTDRLAVAGELDRLRNDLLAARAHAGSSSACAAHTAARDELLSAMARDIERLGEQGAAAAAAADGHAADALMLWRVSKPGAQE